MAAMAYFLASTTTPIWKAATKSFGRTVTFEKLRKNIFTITMSAM
jgi:hypothetical protein